MCSIAALVAASPEHLVSDDGILSRDDVVDVGGEPLQEAGTCGTQERQSLVATYVYSPGTLNTGLANLFS